MLFSFKMLNYKLESLCKSEGLCVTYILSFFFKFWLFLSVCQKKKKKKKKEEEGEKKTPSNF